MSRNEEIPVATAVPVPDNSSILTNSTPAYNQAPVAHPANAYQFATTQQAPFQENDEIGICRRCRRQFRRQPGIHNGLAQYYRCADCEKLRMQDTIYGSCILC